jgi:hypothetical protein
MECAGEMEPIGYFSADAGPWTRRFYYLFALTTLVYTLLAFLAPLIAPTCEMVHTAVQHPNPDYPKGFANGCHFVRLGVLGGLNRWEADMLVRVVMSILCGSIIGWERRRADRPAGIRTMALVCLGSCVFTIDSVWAFRDGPMAWDASRVSAAIPSGVGFLGAASIWKGTFTQLNTSLPARCHPSTDNTGRNVESGTRTSSSNGDGPATIAPEVHGLTTATSVWLSAAIGILCGGALYAVAFFTTAASVVYLRFAPR